MTLVTVECMNSSLFGGFVSPQFFSFLYVPTCKSGKLGSNCCNVHVGPQRLFDVIRAAVLVRFTFHTPLCCAIVFCHTHALVIKHRHQLLQPNATFC